MAINPNSMRPVEVARLINSTPLGFILAQARIYRDFNRVGFRIAASDNSRNINLLKYIAWLCDEKHTVRDVSGPRGYDDRRDAERTRQAEQSLIGRDIGNLPPVANPTRKAACERNFQLFCESYFPETYTLAWRDDADLHQTARQKILLLHLSGEYQEPRSCLSIEANPRRRSGTGGSAAAFGPLPGAVDSARNPGGGPGTGGRHGHRTA